MRDGPGRVVVLGLHRVPYSNSVSYPKGKGLFSNDWESPLGGAICCARGEFMVILPVHGGVKSMEMSRKKCLSRIK